MKKASLFLFISFLSLIFLNAQVGVNTRNPFGWFHVDPSGNTGGTAAAPTNHADDVIITTNGNMGIGTALPTNKLTIAATGANTGLHLPNGASAGQVLTSDANGNGVWNQPGFSEFTNIPYATNNVTLPAGTHFFNTGLSFTFPTNGTYAVTLQCRMLGGPAGATIVTDRPILQILPNITAATNLTTAWYSAAASARFTGSYEIMSIARALEPIPSGNEYRFIFSQNIEVTNNTGLVATLIVYLRTNAEGTFSFSFGTPNGAIPIGIQTVGGSFVRIN